MTINEIKNETIKLYNQNLIVKYNGFDNFLEVSKRYIETKMGSKFPYTGTLYFMASASFIPKEFYNKFVIEFLNSITKCTRGNAEYDALYKTNACFRATFCKIKQVDFDTESIENVLNIMQKYVAVVREKELYNARLNTATKLKPVLERCVETGLSLNHVLRNMNISYNVARSKSATDI